MNDTYPRRINAEINEVSEIQAESSASGVDRRHFLRDAALVAGGLMFGGAQAAGTASTTVTEAEMAKLAVFLTGKADLSTELVRRARHALLAADAAFDRKLSNLIQRIHTAGLRDVEAFRTSVLAKDSELMSAAIAVISAFYTGRVGGTYRGHLVSYEEALMYRPTADVTVIPTYARGVPGYWIEAP